MGLLPLILMFVVLWFLDDPPADEAREGTQGHGRGARQG